MSQPPGPPPDSSPEAFSASAWGPQAGPEEPTIHVDGGDGGAPSALDRQMVDAAVRSGLITAAQAQRLLEAGGGAVGALVRQGLISPEQAGELEEMVKSDFVPGFRLVDELGRGGMGVVYRAVQKSLDRVVALKVVNPQAASDPAFRQRFRQEAKALARLNHPHIVQVYDHGETADRVWIALELVDGRDAGAVVRAEGRFPADRALRVVRDAALGLRHAHETGIIHRDVKPGNLMLVVGGPRGDDEVVKVTDLGLARLTSSAGGADGEASLTKAGTVMGSPAYMAPEQSRGKPVDFRADVYALGATLYHLVTGKAPYSGSSAVEVLLKKNSEPLPSPLELAPELDDRFLRVLDRMLVRDPEQRYASYDLLLDDLEALLAGREPRAQPVPPGSSSLTPPTPEALAETVTTPAPAAAEVAPERRSGGAALVVVAVAAVAVVAGATAWGLGGPRGGVATGPSPAGPSAALAAAVAAFEARPAAAVLADRSAVEALLDEVAGLSPAAAPPLRRRVVDALAAAAEAEEPATLARLDRTWRRGDYALLAAEAEAARWPYELAGRPLPERLAQLEALAGAAAVDGAGGREREVWTRAQASADPAERVELLVGFAERFPFSPAIEEAAGLLAEAERELSPVRLRVAPAEATLTLDGAPLASGSWEGRLRAGEHVLRAEAPGFFPAEARVEVAPPAPVEVALRLDPRPRRELVQDPLRERPAWRPRPGMGVGGLVRQWSIEAGSWQPVVEVSGIRGEGLGTSEGWSVLARDVSRSLEQVQADGAPGWQLQWKCDPPAAGSAAEVRLLAAADGRAVVVGVSCTEAYLALRGADGALEVLGRQPLDPAPGYYEADWDGETLLVRAGERRLGAVRPSWEAAAPGTIRLAVRGSEAVFRDLRLFALQAAD